MNIQERDQQSIDNFIADMIIRSFDNTFMIYAVHPDFGKTLEITKVQKKTFLQLYENIVENINETITFVHGRKNYEIEEVFFHPKFGWTIKTECGKAYLGKINKSLESQIEIGLMSYISGISRIYGNGKLKIGSFTSIADGFEVLTSNYSHPTHLTSTYNFSGNQRIVEEGLQFATEFENKPANKNCNIGNDVWIGKDVTIMNNLDIANGSVVGMKSLVTKNTNMYGIYAGIPARLIRYRFEIDKINELSRLKWWDWDLNKIKDNSNLF